MPSEAPSMPRAVSLRPHQWIARATVSPSTELQPSTPLGRPAPRQERCSRARRTGSPRRGPARWPPGHPSADPRAAPVRAVREGFAAALKLLYDIAPYIPDDGRDREVLTEGARQRPMAARAE